MFRTIDFSGYTYAITLALCLLGLGCSDDAEPAPTGGPSAVDGGGDTNEDASTPDCVLASDGTCPGGCRELNGWPLEDQKACRLPKVAIGCAPEGSAFSDEVGCFVELESGTMYSTPALYDDHLGPAYRECTGEERELSYELARNVCE